MSSGTTDFTDERALARLVDIAREGLLLVAADGRILAWNAGAERTFGYPRSDAMGERMDTLIGSCPPLVAAELRWTGELTCIRADGQAIEVEYVCEADADTVACAMRDVSEQRRAEKEIVLLRNLMEERIRKRSSDLHEMNEDLRDFAYSLAHDMRAPLASIDGFSAQLERRLAESLDETNRHYLRRVRAGVKHMSDLTDGLLALSEVSHAQIVRRVVDVSALARATVRTLQEYDPTRDVEVVVDDTPAATGDARLIAQVLQHLLGNAWKFTAGRAKSRIEFGNATAVDGSPCYCVRDNGAGFDPDYAYKLFGPFQRLHGAHEFEGTGIGLAIVRKIVARHGGRVWADARPGEGASFYFTLGA